METNRKILHIEESLERFGNDIDLYKEILESFLLSPFSLKESFEKNFSIENTQSQANIEEFFLELKHQAHKLKGFVGTIGAELLYEALKNFEILLNKQNLKETQEYFLKIQELYSKTESEIQNFLSKNP